MAIPTFPAYAKVIADGFTEKRDFGVIRSDMDSGAARQRPRFSRPIITRSVTILVHGRAAKAAFDGFVESDLNGGTGWFFFADPIDGARKTARFVATSLQWSAQGENWLQQAQIESIG